MTLRHNNDGPNDPLCVSDEARGASGRSERGSRAFTTCRRCEHHHLTSARFPPPSRHSQPARTMSNFKITYFPCRGRCTAIKMILSDQGITWEEDTISSLSEWESSETKKKSAFGQLPGLTDGDFTMYQSNAILRYLARKFDLYGSNDKEAACIDMLNDGVEDLRMKYLKMIYTNYEEGKADFVKSLSVQLNHFEKLLFKNQEGKVCLVGSKICFADYNLFDLLNILEVLQPGTLRPFPLLFAFAARIASRPQISQFLGSDNHRKLPINGNGKQ